MVYKTHHHYSFDNPRQKPSSKWKPIIIVMSVILLLISALTFWSFSSNKASIAQPSSKSSAVKPFGEQTYKSQYLSFKYKGSYKLTRRIVKAPDVEQTLSRDDTTYNKTLAVEIQPLPSNGVTADSGYEFRQLNPALYTSNKIVVGGSSAVEWVRKDGTERTIYLTHNNLYAVISFSLSETNDVSGLPTEESALLQTFQWK